MLSSNFLVFLFNTTQDDFFHAGKPFSSIQIKELNSSRYSNISKGRASAILIIHFKLEFLFLFIRNVFPFENRLDTRGIHLEDRAQFFLEHVQFYSMEY